MVNLGWKNGELTDASEFMGTMPPKEPVVYKWIIHFKMGETGARWAKGRPTFHFRGHRGKHQVMPHMPGALPLKWETRMGF